ncbi:MAG TPA: hypothetical protein VF607_13540, partial [Verrucomicrobiae bacterium]
EGVPWRDQQAWTRRPKRVSARTKLTGDCELVVLAVGFGIDKRSVENHERVLASGYWENDERQWNKYVRSGATQGRKVMVSGDGDGALIEVLNACFAPAGGQKQSAAAYTHLIGILKNWKMPPDLQKELLALEDDIQRRKLKPGELMKRYQALVAPGEVGGWFKVLDLRLRKLRDTLRNKNHVILASTDENYLQDRNFAINRFLVWRCREMGILEVVKGRYDQFKSHGKKITATLVEVKRNGIGKSSPQTELDALVIRHGPNQALALAYPELARICQEKIAPKNELDQTREPYWPLDFFKYRRPQSIEKGNSGRGSVLELRCPHPDPTILSSIKLDVSTFLEKKDGDQALQTYSKYDITLEIERDGYDDFVLEHQLTPSLPFKFRLNGENRSPILKENKVYGNQQWAVAYEIKKAGSRAANGAAPKRRVVKYSLSGDPCGLLPLQDAIGFPIYSYLRLRRLEINVKFHGIIPHHLAKGGRLMRGYLVPYMTPIRRLTYEDGESNDREVITSQKALPLEKVKSTADGSWIWQRSLVWRPHASKKHPFLPCGYFLGVSWDTLVRAKLPK